MGQKLHKRWKERRREQLRLIDDAAERLIEVLAEYGVGPEYGIRVVLSDTVRGQACYVMGLEGDGDECYGDD